MPEPRRWTLIGNDGSRYIAADGAELAWKESVEVVEAAPVEARIAALEGDLKRASDGWFAANEREKVLEAEVERLCAIERAARELLDSLGTVERCTPAGRLWEALTRFAYVMDSESSSDEPPIYGPDLHNHRWRVGSKVRRTIYALSARDSTPRLSDLLIGVMDTPELAAEAVRAHNEVERLRGLLTEAAHYLDSCGCDEEDCPGRQKAAQLHAVLTGPAEGDTDG